eukprot:COSAG03_NODE_10316_length_658_cov_0.742397_1_plen_80_part_10
MGCLMREGEGERGRRSWNVKLCEKQRSYKLVFSPQHLQRGQSLYIPLSLPPSLASEAHAAFALNDRCVSSSVSETSRLRR